jgi:hypothetical protein
MTDLGVLGTYYATKITNTYHWSCESEPDRTIVIFGLNSYHHDVLQRVRPGVYNCLTGIGKLNISIPDEDVIEVKDDENHLVII